MLFTKPLPALRLRDRRVASPPPLSSSSSHHGAFTTVVFIAMQNPIPVLLPLLRRAVSCTARNACSGSHLRPCHSLHPDDPLGSVGALRNQSPSPQCALCMRNFLLHRTIAAPSPSRTASPPSTAVCSLYFVSTFSI
ncbi:hypothetical protein HN51_068788 [Arachis hypogaea]